MIGGEKKANGAELSKITPYTGQMQICWKSTWAEYKPIATDLRSAETKEIDEARLKRTRGTEQFSS